MNAWLDFDTKLQKYTSFTYSSWRTSSEKLKTLLCPTNYLQPTLKPLLTRWKNIKIQTLAVIFHCLNSFQYKNYVAFSLLYALPRENHKINAICFPSFNNGCNPACKVWRRLPTREFSKKGREHLPISPHTSPSPPLVACLLSFIFSTI